jgi:hypothetical protein
MYCTKYQLFRLWFSRKKNQNTRMLTTLITLARKMEARIANTAHFHTVYRSENRINIGSECKLEKTGQGNQ